MAEISLEELRSMMASAAAPAAPAEPAAEPETAPEPEAPAQEPEVVPDEPEVQVAQQVDKDANAFAEMRVNNKQQGDLISQLCGKLGIKYDGNPDQLQNYLHEEELKAQAEKNNIPMDIMRRLDRAEGAVQAWESQQTQQMITNQFANIQNKYGATADDLKTFAQSLGQRNVNPNTANLEAEYVLSNLSAIIDAGVRAALSQDAEISAHSTQPAGTGSASAGTTPDIQVKSAADLKDWLRRMQP